MGHLHLSSPFLVFLNVHNNKVKGQCKIAKLRERKKSRKNEAQSTRKRSEIKTDVKVNRSQVFEENIRERVKTM